jgi:adenylosuccinate synthase
MIFDHHCEIDSAKEALRGKNAIGTTGRGIGPSYSDKISRSGFRLGELRSIPALVEKMMAYYESNRSYFDVLGVNIPTEDELKNKLEGYASELLPLLADTTQMIWSALDRDKRVLLEGAQGTMLDIDHGTFPFVTSSNTISGGACSGAGVSPKEIGKVVGITKAYCTRVGNGPFPTEDFGDEGDRLRVAGAEFGTTTGRPRRCGWFDAVAMRYACRLNGTDEIALMKLDVLDGFKKIKVCTAYKLGDEIIDYVPENMEGVEPIYEEFEGWESVVGARNYNNLPKTAQIYLDKLQDLVGVKIGMVSTSPDRNDTIVM